MYSQAVDNNQLHDPDNDELIEELGIVPGFKKEFSIQSEEPLWIGVSTNISPLFAREFYARGIAMELDQINGDSGVGSTIGGSTIFKPRGGVITFEARNLVQDSYKAVIYSRAVDP